MLKKVMKVSWVQLEDFTTSQGMMGKTRSSPETFSSLRSSSSPAQTVPVIIQCSCVTCALWLPYFSWFDHTIRNTLESWCVNDDNCAVVVFNLRHSCLLFYNTSCKTRDVCFSEQECFAKRVHEIFKYCLSAWTVKGFAERVIYSMNGV